jgi:hypothetical protein
MQLAISKAGCWRLCAGVCSVWVMIWARISEMAPCTAGVADEISFSLDGYQFQRCGKRSTHNLSLLWRWSESRRRDQFQQGIKQQCHWNMARQSEGKDRGQLIRSSTEKPHAWGLASAGVRQSIWSSLAIPDFLNHVKAREGTDYWSRSVMMPARRRAAL